MQCDEIQGFLYSPPVPADRIVELFADLGVEGH
jgi:EAL domain-containing protein (putative c-di-GMP-specific phosphodiesterase class I)